MGGGAAMSPMLVIHNQPSVYDLTTAQHQCSDHPTKVETVTEVQGLQTKIFFF